MNTEKRMYFKNIKSPLEFKNIEDNEERYKNYNPIIDDEISNQKKHSTLGNIK